MKKTVLILVVLISSMLFSSPKINDDTTNKATPEIIEQLTSIVTSILQGEDYAGFKDNISTEAYVINNNTYESIFEVLNNPSKKATFIEGKDITVGFVYLYMPDNKENVYLVLETMSADNTTKNWHSILFKFGKNQKWQIFSWHKS